MRGCFSLVLLQSDTEGGGKKHSGVHTAKWRTDPVCCRILRLLFALAGVQHACPPTAGQRARDTRAVTSSPQTSRCACGQRQQQQQLQLQGAAGRAWSLLPWTAPGVSVASSQVSQLYVKNRRPKTCCFTAARRHSCWTPAPSPRLQRRARAALRRLFGFYFCFRDAEDPGRWRMRRVALPARMRTSCRSAVAELTDAFRWCRGRRSAEGRESNSECSLQQR